MGTATGRSQAYVYQISVSNGGLPKLPVLQARIVKLGVEGDRQRNTLLHGGPDRAVCLFSLERIEALRAEGHPIKAGSAGDNLTLAGLDWDRLRPGCRIRVGESVRLEVMSYTPPCKQMICWFSDGNAERIDQQAHPGWSRLYAKVLEEGIVRTGDAVVLEEA